MTTITLSEALSRNDGQYQVFGTYSGDDDRFIFGVESFTAKDKAERYAKRLMTEHQADHFERIK